MKTLLLFGGSSDERLVSVASAQNVAQQHQFEEHWYIHNSGPVSRVSLSELSNHKNPFQTEFTPVSPPFADRLDECATHLQGHVVFLAMHGAEGEDGRIQAFFEKNRVPFTGSGSEASHACFDKVEAKKVVLRNQITVAEELLLNASGRANWAQELREFLTRHGKIVIKPVASGSSVGLHIISSPADLEKAISKITQSAYGNYLSERFLQGRELTVGVVERKSVPSPLPASEVVINAGFSFDYEGKYLGRGTTEITPAQITPPEMAAAQELALRAHRALGCRGYSRTDLILTSTGPVYLETNTLPGLTKASFIPQQLQAAGISIREFLNEQLNIAANRYR